MIHGRFALGFNFARNPFSASTTNQTFGRWSKYKAMNIMQSNVVVGFFIG